MYDGIVFRCSYNNKITKEKSLHNIIEVVKNYLTKKYRIGYLENRNV